jgi:hypothetical protein
MRALCFEIRDMLRKLPRPRKCLHGGAYKVPPHKRIDGYAVWHGPVCVAPAYRTVRYGWTHIISCRKGESLVLLRSGGAETFDEYVRLPTEELGQFIRELQFDS